MGNLSDRITRALAIARDHVTDTADGKQWVIDQMVRVLTGCPVVTRTARHPGGGEYTYQTLGESAEYRAFVAAYQAGDFGPDTFPWDEGAEP